MYIVRKWNQANISYNFWRNCHMEKQLRNLVGFLWFEELPNKSQMINLDAIFC